jgi:hypothetical protein
MELASMLAGERFSDRPSSVCPVLAALLRAYNDVLDDARRQDLYRFAADSVGTRRTPRTHDRRAAQALAAADGWRSGRRIRRARWRPLHVDAPERVAWYVVASLGRLNDARHAAMLALLDELISFGRVAAPSGVDPERRSARAPRAEAAVLSGRPTALA